MPIDNLRVYFVFRRSLSGSLGVPAPALVFTPVPDDWNDFALRTRFFYRFLAEPGHNDASGEVHLAFQGSDQSPVEQLRAALRDASDFILYEERLPGYYTMHFDMNAYRQMVEQHGIERAETLLIALNDLVAIKRAGRLPAWYSAATKSQPFRLSFMRNAETFFAFHNASTILGGLEQESLTGMSNRLRLEFKLPTFGNSHVIDFSFEHDSVLPKRIAILIGKNGVGKSQALCHFAKSLLRGNSHLQDGTGQKPLISRLLAVSSPGETRNTFPNHPRRPRIFYQRIVLSRNISGGRQSALGDVLVRLARTRDRIRKRSRWELFCSTVSQLVPIDEIVVGMQPNSTTPGGDYTALTDFQEGGEQQRLERWGNVDSRADVYRLASGNVVPLSSGQLTFIRFAAQACLHIENGTMVLIDEPETHLHPNYISDFVQLLDCLLTATGSFAILATHSAYLVREVPSSQVIILMQPSTGSVEASSPRLKTLGADIGAISSFVFGNEAFGDNSFGRLLPRLIEKLQQAGKDAPSMLKALQNELPAEAVMYLRRSLPGEYKL